MVGGHDICTRVSYVYAPAREGVLGFEATTPCPVAHAHPSRRQAEVRDKAPERGGGWGGRGEGRGGGRLRGKRVVALECACRYPKPET